MPVLLVNNAVSRLGASLTSDALALSVSPGDGGKFPSPGTGDWFPLTLIRADGVREIVRCTKRIGDVLTVVRAQEGTPPVPLAAGDRVELRLTVGALNTLFGGPLAYPTFGSMELVATNPYIDFRAGNAADDFTTRIIAEANAVLVIRSAAKEQARFTDDRLIVNGHIQANGLGFFGGGLVRVGSPGATAFTDYGVSGNVTLYNAASGVIGGGTLWHTGNFNPATKVGADGITFAGFASGNTDLPYFLSAADGSVHYLQRRLTYTPVQQGGGVAQLGNAIKIGFDGAYPRITVDATDFGRLITDTNLAAQTMAIVGNQGVAGVGTYVIATNRSGGVLAPGQLIVGSQLTYSNTEAQSRNGGTVGVGTWRCMGSASANQNDQGTTLFMRIA